MFANIKTLAYCLYCLGIFSAAFINSCGYNLVHNQSLLNAKTIAVAGFIEDQPIGIAGDLATAIAQRLAASGVFITNDTNKADAVLSGRIISANITTAPIRDPNQPIEIYRLSFTVLATLTSNNNELWRGQVTLADDFLPSLSHNEPANDLHTEANRHEALLRLVGSVAQNLVDQLRTISAIKADTDKTKD
ncbi:MAG: hypothetical protein JW841_07675 [Deltaproteobacteria bacterium]|nr:hypothetical protein [Deltaproteobacteria bacterium]